MWTTIIVYRAQLITRYLSYYSIIEYTIGPRRLPVIVAPTNVVLYGVHPQLPLFPARPHDGVEHRQSFDVVVVRSSARGTGKHFDVARRTRDHAGRPPGHRDLWLTRALRSTNGTADAHRCRLTFP